MNQPNSQILLSLIQGDEGKAWAADKNGWKEQHEDGEYSVQCHSVIWRDEWYHQFNVPFLNRFSFSSSNVL